MGSTEDGGLLFRYFYLLAFVAFQLQTEDEKVIANFVNWKIGQSLHNYWPSWLGTPLNHLELMA
jgi:hypothetical protein